MQKMRDVGSISGLGRSPGGGYGNPLQYSCLENPMDRGPSLATVHGVAESDTAETTWYTQRRGEKELKGTIEKYYHL